MIAGEGYGEDGGEAKRGAVRAKKRFETTELLQTGLNNVEIILLPGNPSSGVLKRGRLTRRISC